MEKESLKPILESLIFASESALTLNNIVSILDGAERSDVRAALNELMEEYKARSGGIFIEEVAGGYRLRTNPENAPWIKRLFKTGPKRMSRASMETLSIIAYRQPVTRGELEAIRGVDSGGVLSTLLERRLIKITGRKETPGRPVVYGTTKTFLETFDLRDLSCLPTLKEIQALEAEDDTQEASEDTLAEGGERAGLEESIEGAPESVEAIETEEIQEGLDEEPDRPEEAPESEEADETPGEAQGPKEYTRSPGDPLSGEAPEGDSRGRDNIEAQGRRDDSRGACEGEPQGGLGDGGEG
jgi:segregation and condensation protein B